ncbi:MAG TPA: hypothetical protein VH281_02270 [Gaiellaceae bacterium]
MLILVVAGLAAPGAALGNGDPASDVLPFEDVFVSGYALPTTSDLSPAEVAQLKQTVKEAKKSGYPIKVALIGKPGDLGLVTRLWQQPQRYADFLGQELASFGNYHQRLLVVMPNGYGIYSDRDSTDAEKKVLAGLPPAGTREALPTTATKAVRSLAQDQGVPVALPPLEQADKSNGVRDFTWLIAGGVTFVVTAVVVYVGLSMFLARRRLRSGRPS